MPQKRGIVTDQLTNVIQVIQLGKKTGRLTVERGEGQQRQEGALEFVRGQIRSADSGGLRGQAALDWLQTWNTCRFLFEASEPKESPGNTGHTGSNRTGTLSGQLSPIYDTGSHPTRQIPQENGRRVTSKLTHSGYLPAIQPTGTREGYSSTSGKLPSVQPVPGVPQRVGSHEYGMQVITQAGLSRLHLRLYLLIDGRRTTLELLRFMGRPPEEVQQLLHDLKQIGVISYS